MRQLSEIARDAATDLVKRGPVGAVVGVRTRDGAYAEAASGHADLALGLPMTADRQFRIASITKTFVFALILRFHEQGLLQLEDVIGQWLPRHPFADQVTLRHVLMQTGGLPAWATDRLDEIPAAAEWSPRQVIDYHYEKTRPVQPSGAMVYANVGSRIAGYIAEQVGGAPISDLVRHSFINPFELRDTIPPGGASRKPERLATGYAFDGQSGPRDVTWAVPAAWLWCGGDMYSTASDLTVWAHALFTGRVLSPEMTQALRTEWAPGGFHGSSMSHHGLGVMVFTQDHLLGIGYRGTTPGFVSILAFQPELGAAVSVLTNSFSPDPNSIHRAGVEQTLFSVFQRLKESR